ncbi:alpha/beta hydrolase [Rhodohalobacter sp.]|uniref:alpha/beta fold hydrolase n=1 Tax=Rhodohalobacter sp. TaxID=1974210 RepID=UPI002ACEEF4B|nr:alpha/beta hydrolase [Rhodohalobacter sp.]MDZ7757396.1 alpha/beta hydrolase [Rhodohalobacter sp.]
MNRLYFLCSIFLAALFIAGCSGIRYADSDPLPFEDIDYGYDVQFTESEPSIAYIDEGSGDKTLLLVHGLASNAGFWRYNIDALAQDYRVVAIDLPGYGKSDKGDYPYGMDYYAKELVNLMDELSLENVIYIGHSMGGQIGITLALNYPDAIDQLILAAPAGIETFAPGEGAWLANAFSIDGIVNATEPQVRANLSINFYKWSPEWEWMVEERVRMAKDEPEMREFAYTVVNSVSAMIDEPTSGFLSDLNVPTVIIYGKYDGLIPNRYLNPGFPSEVFEKGDQLIPNSSLVEIDDAGHMVMIEKPEEFNRTILQSIR